jgi:NAD(P)-dependent dehydrogenase (short-subunit alcohol dehydrogenase family)
MDLGLENEITLVVNAHLGITTAAAVALAREGAVLALSAPDNQHMRHVELELARQNISQERFRGMIADLDKEQDIRRLVRETLHRQGDVSVLVNVVQEENISNTANLQDDQIEPALSRNFFSAVHLVREVIPHMKRLREGRIINLLPLSALEVSPQSALSSATMAPILAYFKGLASELAASSITVNNIIYEGVQSQETLATMRCRAAEELGADADDDAISQRADAMLQEVVKSIPMKRMAKPHEIGDIICMIASKKASYLTGANIIVDGGLHHTYA